MNTAELKEFVSLEKEKADLKQQLKQVQERLDELDRKLTEQFLQDGMESSKIDGRTVYLRRDIYASAKEGCREAVVAALKACQLSQYVREDYNAKSVEAMVRELVKAAEEEARLDNRVLDDPATAVPPPLAETLKISSVYSISSRRS